MKYLKFFNEGKLGYTQEKEWSDILEDIKDIFIELEDNGFIISYKVTKIINVEMWYLSVSIKQKNLITFKYNDIKDVIERLRYYLSHLSYYKSTSNLIGYPKIKSILDNEPYQNMDVVMTIIKDTSQRSFRKVSENMDKYIAQKNLNNTFRDLEDICLELEDDGFNIFIQRSGYLVINATSFQGRYQYSEVEEVVNRIRDYLGNKFTAEFFLVYSRSGFGNWIDVTEDKIKEEVIGENIEGIGGVKIYFEI